MVGGGVDGGVGGGGVDGGVAVGMATRWTGPEKMTTILTASMTIASYLCRLPTTS